MSGSIDRIIERQIREAQERGMFDNLPGAGKPLGDLGGPRNENWWCRQYLQREGLDGVAFLPPALALRKEAEDLAAVVSRFRAEVEVRAAVVDLNDRILAALKKPSEGPPMTLMQLDVDVVVAEWRARPLEAVVPVEQSGESQRRRHSRLRRRFRTPPR